MDVKALAKSKRAHSNHHSKKHHPHQASKAPSVTSSDNNNKKPTGKQAKVRPPQSHVARPLPSNWERYDENPDLVSGEAQPSSSQPTTEFVAPKSKGADYARLISEAKDQSRANYSSDVFASFDDGITDFTQDFGPTLLKAKGQSILSWAADDDFEFEGKASTSVEIPFLSLNLNALADQLAKAKLSERCFLDPDRFPLELLDDELQTCDEDKHDLRTFTSTAETSRTATLGYNQDFSVQQYHNSSSSAVTATTNVPVQISEGELKRSTQDNIEILHSQGTVTSMSPKSISERVIDSTAKEKPIFKAASAEAELDMLLSSFGETKIIDSTNASSSIKVPTTASVSGETVMYRADMMKSANIDDDIDKLLEETSNPANIDSRWVSNEVRASPDVISSTSNPNPKSKLLDDFDSWLDTI